jgi:hypothetical protein
MINYLKILKAMKTQFLIILFSLLFNMVNVLAVNDFEFPGIVPGPATELNSKDLAPVPPKEATFDDDLSSVAPAFPANSLLPVTPKTADFEETPAEDVIPGHPVRIQFPVILFEDANPGSNPDFRNLNTRYNFTPKEALFEDF